MRFDIITIFPDMFGSVFKEGVVAKGIEKGLLDIRVHDLRDYTTDKHRQVDDRPFGGGPGMVLMPDPLFRAVETNRLSKESPVYVLSPQGQRLNSALAEKAAGCSQILLVCGRYEGIDERVIEHLATDEISIGDYILTGGEPAAWVFVDAVSRFVPSVIGKEESVAMDSFQDGILDCPHYTRPRDYQGYAVPEVLFSGDHKKIAEWRRTMALKKTSAVRPDLLPDKENRRERKRK
ncbi:MAG: tRNA (guanosine(37)-N1)-methyltransferase TrmD [Acidobacteria bacterium]|nr:tRNA (guanosine(37)-N1)-methyltransferase TrmD [Acidobacteriota bacterium]MCG2817042.1 tRNA (guanosine(37)-N1)-methyltransferase TrmD [Candidatus Aminicenantes bacterium]MBU1337605.1 tRNA (guanosine(37)-N1)-methyltransferase TrmD [Acidobacteriota bacterium]MBU1474343.1 tRNA (guanosine(37)-N1)-methyltransferase TrmD [Acidobacteriota bacterium]MBU2439025.1 tRNA (guanosine(37)-N1)-methyltransferase TrmD [Acidobacteriota bacterium]